MKANTSVGESGRLFDTCALIHARTDRALKPGLRPSTLDSTAKVDINGPCEYRPGAGKLVMRGRPIQTFVEVLSRPAYASGRVFDDTGITGNVDIDLEWSMNFSDLPASTASLFTAVQEQLGLKLEPRQIPLPVVVVEQIRRPSENLAFGAGAGPACATTRNCDL